MTTASRSTNQLTWPTCAFGRSLVNLAMPDPPPIDSSWLPATAASEMVFSDSSFFKLHGPSQRLPAPAEVKILSGAGWTNPRPISRKTRNLGLLVKFGSHVAVYEAQCLVIVKKLLGDEVPVPEVYGWQVHDGRVFIYMQLIQGQSLLDQWESLGMSDRMTICEQLRGMVTALHSVRQDPDDTFIGILWNSEAVLRFTISTFHSRIY